MFVIREGMNQIKIFVQLDRISALVLNTYELKKYIDPIMRIEQINKQVM